MDPKTPHFNVPPAGPKAEQAVAAEREAYKLRADGKIDQAFQTFDKAARLFQEAGEPLKAAVCFSSAATCWNIHTGWQPLRNAATRNELAALQAVEAKDSAYAESLFREAALLYEKEGDFPKFSYCYCRAQDARLARLWKTFTRKREPAKHAVGLEPVSWRERMAAFIHWFFGSMDRAVWGYGEMPFRVLGVACGVIILSALCYHVSGLVLTGGLIEKADLFESFYLSVMTYATMGYGDYVPLGWIRGVASVEALLGITLTPLFLIALVRRYLRAR